ncbi:hypothetical protein AAG906_034059 [Vitis piasezkii]
MGGHGGLNILPQKRWNVYNYENREKVRQDEEAAAKEEQLKREQSRKRDAEFRLEKLRLSRGLAPPIQAAEASGSELKSGHINLFEGLKDEGVAQKRKKMKKEEAPKVVLPEDEKYRLGYGVAGKGVKLPWYLLRPRRGSERSGKEGPKSSGKKSLEEMREERLKREKREKERERALLLEKTQRNDPMSRSRGFSRRSWR